MIDRDYHRLDQAADLSKYKVDDLIHFGATGKLPIYLLVEGGFYPQMIWETSYTTEETFPDIRLIESSDDRYKTLIFGPLRVRSSCLKAYESRSSDVSADFDWIGHKEGSCRIYTWFLPDHTIHLRADNMVVMANDLPLLTEGGVEKPIRANVERSMLQLIIGMAMGRYRYDPTEKKSSAVAAIAKDLELCGISLDEDTVRAYLKKAAAHLPQPPAAPRRP